MPSTYEIIKDIKQAAHDAQDFPEGYGVPEGEVDFLKRSEGDKIQDSRVMDGFSVRINGNILTIVYQSEVTMEEAHGNDFENEIKRKLNDIKNFLQNEYNNLSDNTISLQEMDRDPDILTQYLSRVRIWVEAQQHYRIPAIDPVEDEEQEEREEIADDIDVLIREARKKAKEDE